MDEEIKPTRLMIDFHELELDKLEKHILKLKRDEFNSCFLGRRMEAEAIGFNLGIEASIHAIQNSKFYYKYPERNSPKKQ